MDSVNEQVVSYLESDKTQTNTVLTHILADANSYYPQDAHMSYKIVDFPLAMKAAQILLSGKYKGKEVSIEDIVNYSVDLDVAMERTNAVHKVYGIPIFFVKNEKDISDESENDQKERRVSYKDLDGFFKRFASDTKRYLIFLVTDEAIKLKLNPPEFEDLTQIHEFLSVHPEIKIASRMRVDDSLKDIDSETKEYRELFRSAGFPTSEERLSLREKKSRIGQRISEKLKKYRFNSD